MKNLFLLLLIVSLLVSCKQKTERPEPISINYQAPFGNYEPKVKIKELLSDKGELGGKFIYEDGHVSELRRYVTYNDEKPWFTVSFRRNKDMLESYEVKAASFSPEGRSVADLPNPGYILRLGKIKNDTILEYQPTEDISGGRSYLTVQFDNKGYVIRQEGYNLSPSNRYVASYKRDLNNNISEVTHTFISGSSFKMMYKYDDHPNPFFETGIGLFNDAISNFSLSPNNVVEEVRFGVDDYKGYINRVTTEYEYLPNGYPSKVKMVRYITEPGGVEEKSSEASWAYTYY